MLPVFGTILVKPAGIDTFDKFFGLRLEDAVTGGVIRKE
jgi:hypothetical protein